MKNRLLALIAISVLVQPHAEAFFRVKRTLSPSARAWAALRSTSKTAATFAQRNKLVLTGVALAVALVADQYTTLKKDKVWEAQIAQAQERVKTTENALLAYLNEKLTTVTFAYAPRSAPIDEKIMQSIFASQKSQDEFFKGNGAGFDSVVPEARMKECWSHWAGYQKEIQGLAQDMRQAHEAARIKKPVSSLKRAAQAIKKMFF